MLARRLVACWKPLSASSANQKLYVALTPKGAISPFPACSNFSTSKGSAMVSHPADSPLPVVCVKVQGQGCAATEISSPTAAQPGEAGFLDTEIGGSLPPLVT